MSGVMDAWEDTRLPDAYLSRHCLEGSDGRTILNYAQWTGPEAHRSFATDPHNQRTLRSAVQALYTAGPPGRYTLHRSVSLRAAPVRCFTTTSYDTEDAAAARALAEKLAARTSTAPELVAEHFHVAEDGRSLYVLAAHEAEPEISAPRFCPYRGWARTPAARSASGPGMRP
ncbi:hypothetical protein ACIQWL_52610 [Streptomyces mirabilis]|uniref:hypothetical protein n=1 Tax=Streptomyces mirabilis TaxID=68239 RepID=UPI00225A19BC|nr:hypothetical protein [Streptomyces mirabilis]MCX4428534.1 hypothetical protein [Streptomyces mirabilis]